MPSPFSCSPVIRECLWKKIPIEKKTWEIFQFIFLMLEGTRQNGGKTKDGKKQNCSQVEDFPVCSLHEENTVLPVMYMMSNKPLNRDMREFVKQRLTGSEPLIILKNIYVWHVKQKTNLELIHVQS